MILCKDFNKNEIIRNIDDWYRLCPPLKKNDHWKDGKSAKELAKDWIINEGQQLFDVLNLSEEFSKTNFKIASPRFKSIFDSYRGPMQHNLLILGENKNGEVLISIEANSDEPFREEIGKYYNKALKERNNGSNTKIPNRIEELNFNIFGNTNIKSIFQLRYQLLYGIAGIIAEAKRCGVKRAIFVVNTYQSNDSRVFDNKKHIKNLKDLDNFIKILSRDKVKKIGINELKGPFNVKKSKYFNSDLELYILKMETSIND